MPNSDAPATSSHAARSEPSGNTPRGHDYRLAHAGRRRRRRQPRTRWPSRAARSPAWVRATQIAAALAELGVADALSAQPRTASDIAAELGLPPASLHRLLRAAATVGLVDEPSPRLFGATAQSDLLRPGVEGSLHNFARNVAGHGHWSVWGRLSDAIRTETSPAEPVLGTSLWDYYRAHPDEERCFAAAMSERTASQIAAIVATADLRSAHRIVDVGGSQGRRTRCGSRETLRVRRSPGLARVPGAARGLHASSPARRHVARGRFALRRRILP
jgi:hypothetical protein